MMVVVGVDVEETGNGLLYRFILELASVGCGGSENSIVVQEKKETNVQPKSSHRRSKRKSTNHVHSTQQVATCQGAPTQTAQFIHLLRC